MMELSSLFRFCRLGWRNRWLLVEALYAMAVAAALVRLLPFRRAIRYFGEKSVCPDIIDAAEVRRIAWSIDRVSGLVPWRAVCIQQGIAAQWMLRRRHIDAILNYGIGEGPENELAAHVWISVAGVAIIGGEVAANFRTVATYPKAMPPPADDLPLQSCMAGN